MLAAGQDLVAAARSGDTAAVESLLASGVEVNAKDREGSTALMFAAVRGDARMVAKLLAAGADPNLKDANGETALILGASHGVEIVRALLSEGADPNLADGEGQTALLVAAENQAATVRLLIDSGADVNHLDAFGVGALTIAEASGAQEIVAMLRQAGAKANLADRLHDAIEAGDLALVRRLLAEGADVNGFDTAFYETPLMAALRHRRLEILEALLQAGANPAVEAKEFENAGDTAIVGGGAGGQPVGRSRSPRGDETTGRPRRRAPRGVRSPRGDSSRAGDESARERKGRTG